MDVERLLVRLPTMNHLLALLALVSAVFTADLNATDKEGGPMTRPLSSPWDANAWEPGSDQAFWRAGAERSKASAQHKASAPRAATPRPAASILPQVEPKSDFSSRQSEK